jgi:hypothetical protein
MDTLGLGISTFVSVGNKARWLKTSRRLPSSTAIRLLCIREGATVLDVRIRVARAGPHQLVGVVASGEPSAGTARKCSSFKIRIGPGWSVSPRSSGWVSHPDPQSIATTRSLPLPVLISSQFGL